MNNERVIRIILLFLFITAPAKSAIAQPLITMQRHVVIDRPLAEVFTFAADARNDIHWRSEVHSIEADGLFELHSRYLEDARLGRHPHYFTETQIVELNPPHVVVYHTTNVNPYFLESYRRFEALDAGTTRFTYAVTVEKDLIEDILGAAWPNWLVRAGYQLTMGHYLYRLKRLIE